MMSTLLPLSLLLLLSSGLILARTAYTPCTEPVEVRFPSGSVSPVLVPETLSDGRQVVRVQVRFSRPVLVDFFADFGRFDAWAGPLHKTRFVGRLAPISFVGDLASGDLVWEPSSQSYASASNDLVEIVFEMISGNAAEDVLFRPFHLLIAPNTIRSVARAAGRETTLVPVPAMVLGRYYLSYQRILDTDHAETAQLANPSLYCRQFPYRPALQQWFSPHRTEASSLVNVQLAKDDVTLEISEHGWARVHFPISVAGEGTGSLPLPKVVKAKFGAQVVTVRLPDAQLEMEHKGRTLRIALSTVSISEQRERAFHQQPSPGVHYHTCMSGRRNNLSFLPVHHVLENSGEFWVYLPEKDPANWAIVAGGTRARVVHMGGADSSPWTDLQLELPHGILSGIQRYAFLWPPPSPPGPVESGVHFLANEYVDLEASGDIRTVVFVPRELVERTGCGTLNITYEQFIGQTDFCNTTIGSCVGMPLFSTKRFPLIPPFGLPELACPNCIEFGIGNGTERHLTVRLEAADVLGSISVDKCTVLEPCLYQSLQEWVTAPPSTADLCPNVWHISPNTHTPQQELTATLTARIDNAGQGGGNVSFTVKCSKLIDVVSGEGESFVWTEPGETATAVFTLSGSRALSLPLGEHKCQLGVSIVMEEDLPWLPMGKVMPVCTTALRTHHGAFKDPCIEPEQPLPETKVDFHFLPQSELSKNEVKGIQSVLAEGYSFMRTLTAQLWVPEEEVELVYHLREMSVDCANQQVLIMDRERLALVDSAWEGQQEDGIGYKRDLLSQKRLFFFIKKQADTDVVMGCKVVVLANRPHVACPQPVVVLEKEVILTKADHNTYHQTQQAPLQAMFGDQPTAVLYTLIACALAVPLLLGGAGAGHILLFICRKRLPLRGEVEWKREQLKQAKLDEKRRWENPATYLEEGPQGPFYLLHNFRATAPLDSNDLKPVKMAGTLRHKDKELPVMFGHLKQVWVESGGNTWVQASSGMYLLEYEEAAVEYQTEHRALLARQNPELDHLLPSEAGCHGDVLKQEGVATGGDNADDA